MLLAGWDNITLDVPAFKVVSVNKSPFLVMLTTVLSEEEKVKSPSTLDSVMDAVSPTFNVGVLPVNPDTSNTGCNFCST